MASTARAAAFTWSQPQQQSPEQRHSSNTSFHTAAVSVGPSPDHLHIPQIGSVVMPSSAAEEPTALPGRNACYVLVERQAATYKKPEVAVWKSCSDHIVTAHDLITSRQ